MYTVASSTFTELLSPLLSTSPWRRTGRILFPFPLELVLSQKKIAPFSSWSKQRKHCCFTFCYVYIIHTYMCVYICIQLFFSWPGAAGIFLCVLLTYKAWENFVLLSCRISSKVLFCSILWQIVAVKLFLSSHLGCIYGLHGSSWLLLWSKEIFLRKWGCFTPKSIGQFSSEDSATSV